MRSGVDWEVEGSGVGSAQEYGRYLEVHGKGSWWEGK